MENLKNLWSKCRQKCEDFWRKLREVPEVITFGNFFDYPRKFLGYISYDHPRLWEDRNRKWKSKNCRMFGYLLNILIFPILVGFEAHMNNDSEKKITSVIIFSLWMVLVVKMLRYFWKKKEVIKLQNSIRKFYPKTCTELVRKYLRNLKIVHFVTQFCLIFYSFGFALIPIIVYAIQGKLISPLNLFSFLIDIRRIWIYPFVYIWELCVPFQCLLVQLAFDLMTITLVVAISQEWSQLGQDFGKNLSKKIQGM